jgi:hypothetical protein
VAVPARRRTRRFATWEWSDAVLALFAFTMVGSIAVTQLNGRVPVQRGVLLGEWPKKAAA